MKYASIASRLSGLGAAKWAVHVEGRRRAAKGDNLIFLSIGEPDLPPPAAVLDAARKGIRPGNVGYNSAHGGERLRQALANSYTRSTGRTIASNQFLFVPGGQGALYIAFQTILDPGDEVVLLDPYYATYEAVVTAPGGVPRPVRLDADRGFHIDFDALEKAVTPRTRAILLNSPSNPTGAVFTADEIARVGALAEKHDLWIVSDEVYATLVHGSHRFTSPFADPALAKRTIVVSSIAKSHALPGFRCGWIAASEQFCTAAKPVSETMLFSSHPFLEGALTAALEQDFPENAAAKHAYFSRAQALVQGLHGVNKLRAHLPEGGMFVMIDVRATGLSGDDFALRLLNEEAVVTMPGESFGAGGAGHVRVALTVDEATMAEAARRITNLANHI
jgi:arginine:pyruvate transaminase